MGFLRALAHPGQCNGASPRGLEAPYSLVLGQEAQPWEHRPVCLPSGLPKSCVSIVLTCAGEAGEGRKVLGSARDQGTRATLQAAAPGRAGGGGRPVLVATALGPDPGSAVGPGAFFVVLAPTVSPCPPPALPEFAQAPVRCPTRAIHPRKASARGHAGSRPLLPDVAPRPRAPGQAGPQAHRPGWPPRPGPANGARGGGGARGAGPRGTRWRRLGPTGQRREGRAGKRGSGKRAAAGTRAAERRERRGREEGARRRAAGGRRERGRQAEGGLISMQQRSRARLHCFNTSPLLRANLSPFSRRTLLPQMLLFSNETDN